MTSSFPAQADYDAPVGEKQQPGAIILGKTASPEFGRRHMKSKIR